MSDLKHFVEELKSRLSVSEVAGKHMRLKRQGREWVGLSPFTREKTPSFTINDQKGFWHCFSSGKHGDIISFLTETRKIPFLEAVEQLARQAGLTMPSLRQASPERARLREGLLQAHSLAVQYFRQRLDAPAGKPARAYLTRRGLDPELIRKFQLGFAPPARTGLKTFLRAQGLAEERILEAGLLIAPQDGGQTYDRFRNRIIFPITDAKGAVIAFGGRAMDKSQTAKYLNSPETPLFKKGDNLYALASARPAALQSGNLIVVEGYMDALALHGKGLAHCVAGLGTALTERQIQLLWRLAPEPVVCLDGDEAGRRAAARLMERALPVLRPGCSLRFAALPEGRDPDDLIRERGLEALNAAIEDALPLIDALYLNQTARAPADTPEQRAALAARLDQLAGSIRDPNLARYYRQTLRARIEDLFWRADRFAPGGSRDRRRGPQPAAPRTPPDGDSAHERLLLAILAAHPDLFAQRREGIERLWFASQAHSALRDELLRILDQAADDPARLAFHEQVEDRFQHLLQGIRGRETGPAPYFSQFPLARLVGDPDFLARCLDHLLRVQNWRALVEERKAAHADYAAELNEDNHTRFSNLHHAVESERLRLHEAAAELAAEAARRIEENPEDAPDWSALFTPRPPDSPDSAAA